MSLLYGVHDLEGLVLVPDGGWSLVLVKLKDKPSPTSFDSRVNVLVRLNWGYEPTGTIPLVKDEAEYLDALSRFVSRTTGVHSYIIGNEPNLTVEWPDKTPITVRQYVSLYNQAYEIIENLSPSSGVIPAAIAPYNPGWTDWITSVFNAVVGADGFAIHAYARSSNPAQISDENLKMQGAPLTGQYSGFLTYRDALAALPPSYRNIPAYITEFNENQPWEDKNTGVIGAAYEEINAWNRSNGHQKIHCICVYRYPKYDRFFIEGKNGVIADFNQAVSKGYSSPNGGSTVHIPSIEVPSQPVPTPSQPPLDPALVARGVTLTPAQGDTPDMQTIWQVVGSKWLNVKESQGRHHIYVDTLDEAGHRMVGVKLKVIWSTGFKTIVSEEKPGEPYSANYPMSPSRNDYSIRVVDENHASDTVSGIGMGADLGSGFNASEHTSTALVYQLVKQSAQPMKPASKPSINLIYPTEIHTISQSFGAHDVDYSPYLGHEGIDFAVPTGTDVHAVDEGVVLEAGNLPQTYGIYVKLAHSWGESLYGHLLKSLVQQDQEVKQGQLIGISDSTGRSTGPHLHFGIRIYPYNRNDGYNGFSDPAPYLESHVHPSPFHPHDEVLADIEQAAEEMGIDYELLASHAWAESSFDPQVNARGLMQISDEVWQAYAPKLGARDILNPLDNARVGAAYFKDLLAHYKGDKWKALEAYTWGPGNLDNSLRELKTVPEVVNTYANKIIHGYELLKAVGR